MPRVRQIGERPLRIAQRWFAPTVVAAVFEPLIADWQREWADAPAHQRVRVSLLGWSAFIKAVIISSPRIARTSSPPAVTNRIVTRIATFTLLCAALLVMPIVLSVSPAWAKGLMVFFTIPGALVLAFPFSVVAAVDVIRGDQAWPAHVERAAVVKLAVTSVALMMVFSGWVNPAANSAWRRAMRPPSIDEPARGFRELTTYELIVEPSRAHALENTNRGGRGAAYQRELQNRAAMAVLPLILIWLRWVSLERLTARRWYSPMGPVAATLAAVTSFVALQYCATAIDSGGTLPPGVALWLPALAMVICGIGARLLMQLSALEQQEA